MNDKRKITTTYGSSKDEFFDHLIAQIERMRADDRVCQVWLVFLSEHDDGCAAISHYTNGPDEVLALKGLNDITVRLMIDVLEHRHKQSQH